MRHAVLAYAAGLEVRRLSPRQRQVLEALAAGLSDQAIADELGISEGTVGTHVQDIYRRMGLVGVQGLSPRVMAALVWTEHVRQVSRDMAETAP